MLCKDPVSINIMITMQKKNKGKNTQKNNNNKKNPSRPVSLDGVQIKTNSTVIYFVYD